MPTRAPLVVTAVPTLAPPASPTPTPTSTPAAVVRDALTGTDGSLYVRAAPSLMADIIRTASDLAPFTPIGRSDDSAWVEVQFLDGEGGWIMARAVTLVRDLAALPVTGSAARIDDAALLTAETELRANPNSASEVVASLDPLTPLRLTGRLEDGAWFQGETAAGESGWVEADSLAFALDPADLPVITITLPSGQVAASAGGLRLRQSPGDSARVIMNLPALTPVTIEGRTADSRWLLIRTGAGAVGWVAAAFIDTDADLSAVPVAG
jgi:uncharacterized protein YgiM (DUF1202 family)